MKPLKPIVIKGKQTDAWTALEDKTTEEILYGGGTGGGKSFLGCVWHIHRRTSYPGTRGLIAREELKNLKQTTLETFFEVCTDYFGFERDKDFKYNANQGEIEWSNGSTTILSELKLKPSDPDYHSFGSTEFTDIFIDEAGEVDKRAFDILKTRIRFKLAEYDLAPKILLTCNPGDHWIKEYFVKDAEGNSVVLKPYQKFIPALLEDNPDEQFKAVYGRSMSHATDYDRQRLLEGDWDAQPKLGGEFYKKFEGEKHIIDTHYRKDMPLHLTFDFNKRPYVTLCVWQVEGFRAEQIDEICLSDPRNNSMEACKEFCRKYAAHEAGVFVYGDPAGKQEDTRSEAGHNDFTIIAAELRNYKPVFRIPTKHPSVAMRGRFINDIFAGNYSFIPDRIEIYIGRNCKKTITDYCNVKESPDGTKLKKKAVDPATKKQYEIHGHTSDANDYFLTECFKEAYQKYLSAGKRVVIQLAGARASQGMAM